jgi:prophage tail gpP-like protein
MAASEDDELTVQTNGATLSGWQEVEVRRGVTSCPSSFMVSLTERYPGDVTGAIVTPGATCTVFLGGDQILNGYIDRLKIEIDGNSHRVSIVGRGRAEDVVDSSADPDALGGWEFRGGMLGATVRKLIAPYNVGLQLPDGDVSLPSVVFSIQPGVTCYSMIEQLARATGQLVWDASNGDLVIGQGGTGGRAGNALVEGANIEVASAEFGMDMRFSDYLAVLQDAGLMGHVSLKGEAKDSGVTRHRLKMIIVEGTLINNYPTIRAQWEAARRLGRSRIAHVTVTGWRDVNGDLWTPNTVCSIQSPTLKISEDRVIAECVWKRSDEGGTQTEMMLIEEKGLKPQPFIPVDIFGVT